MAALAVAVEALVDRELDLAWSLWAELGVAGLERRHRQVIVHPEALLAFTAPLLPHDARLRDEVLSWCLLHHRWIGQRQLLHVLRPVAIPAHFGDLAATVAAHDGPRWPGHGVGTPLRFHGSSRDLRLRFTRPSLAIFRFRAAFGLHARAEILAALLNLDGEPTAVQLQDYVASTPRNLRDALGDLVSSGLVTTSGHERGARFRLVAPGPLGTLMGPLASTARWKVLVPLVSEITRVLATSDGSPIQRSAEVLRTMRRTEGSWRSAGELPPAPSEETDYALEVATWSLELLKRLDTEASTTERKRPAQA